MVYPYSLNRDSVVLKEKMMHLNSLATILKEREQREGKIDPYLYRVKEERVSSQSKYSAELYEATGEEGRRVSYVKENVTGRSQDSIKIESDPPKPAYQKIKRKEEVFMEDDSDVIVLESTIDPAQEEARDDFSVDLVVTDQFSEFGDVGEREMDWENKYPVVTHYEENIPEEVREEVKLPPWKTKALPVSNNQFDRPVKQFDKPVNQFDRSSNQFEKAKETNLGGGNQFMNRTVGSVASSSRPATASSSRPMAEDRTTSKAEKSYPWTDEVMIILKDSILVTLISSVPPGQLQTESARSH